MLEMLIYDELHWVRLIHKILPVTYIYLLHLVLTSMYMAI